MKSSISTKLFVAVLASVLSVILIMGLTANWSFARGFLGYLNEQAMQRMSPVLPRLAVAYAREGSWEFMRDNKDRWFEVMRPEPAQDFAIPGLATPPTSDLTGAVFRIALLDAQKNLVMGFPGVHDDEFMRPVEVAGKIVGWPSHPFRASVKRVASAFSSTSCAPAWRWVCCRCCWPC
ncbi:Sensor histidine kinase BaeS [Pseudomonas syringae pv. rhaphiolepidis]|nr:Sensor histidine kinase BaeS [Pseudomonas syringae pv. rhaphiolepidis]